MAQRDPHEVLEVPRDASPAVVKAAWRRLAREHHPDLAADSAARRDATRRMAEINAAYQALRAGTGRAGKPERDPAAAGAPASAAPPAPRPSGPPPPPPTRPVTARLDTTDLYRPRNATTTPAGGGFRHRPRPPATLRRATWWEAEEPRASDPTGPLQRVRARRAPRRPLPDLDAARATEIVFGKFHGRTLGEIAEIEPSYLAWVERTITRDPDLVAAARVVLDEREREVACRDGDETPSEGGDAGQRPREGAVRGTAG
jgi:DnaJ domain